MSVQRADVLFLKQLAQDVTMSAAKEVDMAAKDGEPKEGRARAVIDENRRELERLAAKGDPAAKIALKALVGAKDGGPGSGQKGHSSGAGHEDKKTSAKGVQNAENALASARVAFQAGKISKGDYQNHKDEYEKAKNAHHAKHGAFAHA